jgi:hypothetical protein
MNQLAEANFYQSLSNEILKSDLLKAIMHSQYKVRCMTNSIWNDIQIGSWAWATMAW